MLSQIGHLVEISWVAMTPAERAGQLPEESKKVPVVARLKGFALGSVSIGEVVNVKTFAGRIVTGTLIDLAPQHTHSFGRPQEELLSIGPRLREELE